jgi:hypothetical protein
VPEQSFKVLYYLCARRFIACEGTPVTEWSHVCAQSQDG